MGQQTDCRSNPRWLRTVLDLGCGDGSLTCQIADLVADGEVVGIDASKGMIEVAKSKEQNNLKFLNLDINHLDFESEFHVVFSNAALHWVKDHTLLLKNVHRALIAGGRLRFQFAGHGNCANLYEVVQPLMEQDDYKPHFSDFVWPWFMPPVEDYQRLAETSGLRGIRVWCENADRYFPDADAMIQWIDQPSLVPFLNHLPASIKQSFRDQVVSQMIEITQQKDGRCFETFRRINVSAQR